MKEPAFAYYFTYLLRNMTINDEQMVPSLTNASFPYFWLIICDIERKCSVVYAEGDEHKCGWWICLEKPIAGKIRGTVKEMITAVVKLGELSRKNW
jgi:hypothetical protein